MDSNNNKDNLPNMYVSSEYVFVQCCCFRALVLDGVTDFLLFLCKLFVVGGMGNYSHAC